ncbi:MAG: CDP-glycerol glycerophosphotransferase family protein, partial [Bifidobacteriaceae bacterium]|nr:CDP-glycerol glycerophosphotransferase family protein [Bifidobacteriaceae bacterium]
DLETFHIKRSLVRRDDEYIYLDHGMTSFHLMLREEALDHFDTVFAYGPNHIEEIRQSEELRSLPAKRVVPSGYPLLDDLLDSVAGLEVDRVNDPKVALVAPSWQIENLMELCLEQTVRPLLQAGFRVVVRPHPEFVKRFKEKMAVIAKALEADVAAGRLELQTDFSSNFTVYTADLVVTDWSSIAQEFSYATGKPSIFINTPMKVMNPNWERLTTPPLDITLREMIGVCLDVEELDRIGAVALELVHDAAAWRERIQEVLEDNIYFLGQSEQAMGAYLVEATSRFTDHHQAEDASSSKTGKGKKAAAVRLGGLAAWVALVLTFAMPNPANAYIDPATTSYLIQVVSGLVITLSVALGVFFRRIVLFLMTVRARAAAAWVVLTTPRHRRRDQQRTTTSLVSQAGAGSDAAREAAAGAAAEGPDLRYSRSVAEVESAAWGPVHATGGAAGMGGGTRLLGIGVVPGGSEGTDSALPTRAGRRFQTSIAPTGSQSQTVTVAKGQIAGGKRAFLWADERRWGRRLALALPVGFAPGFLLFVFGLLNLYQENAEEFPFTSHDLLGPALLLFGVSGLAVTIVLVLFKGRVFDLLVSLVLGFTLAAWVQGTFLNLDLGELNGLPVRWERYAKLALSNTLIWVLVLAVPLLLRVMSRKIWTLAAWLAPVVLIASGTVALVNGYSTLGPDTGPTGERYPTYTGAFTASKANNQYIFVLDMMDQKFVEEIQAEDPDFFASQLDGFTQFDNNLSNYTRTLPSAADMLTGERYQFDEPLDQYFARAYQKGEFLPALRKAGYSTNIYATNRYSYYNITDIEGLADNIEETKSAVNREAVLKAMLNLDAFRYAPHIAKATFWAPPDRFAKTVEPQGAIEPFDNDNYTFYERIHRPGLNLEGDQPRFSYIHLNGAHTPAAMDRNVKPVVPGSVSLAEQARGAFKITFDYLEQLRQLGVYKDASIVITADHG